MNAPNRIKNNVKEADNKSIVILYKINFLHFKSLEHHINYISKTRLVNTKYVFLQKTEIYEKIKVLRSKGYA